MRRVARFFIWLYPAQWRERYGQEIETVIDDSSPGWRAMLDLLKGAMRMQLHIPAFPKLAVIFSLAGLVCGLGVSMLVTPRYVSTAEIELVDRQANAPSATPRPDMQEYVKQMEQEILSRTSLSSIMQDPRLDLYAAERKRLPLEDVIEGMRSKDIRIRMRSAGSNYAGFAITFSYSDRIRARETVQALVTKFADHNMVRASTETHAKRIRSINQVDRLEARIAVLEKRLGILSPAPEPLEFLAPASGAINLDVIDPPSLPTEPVYPHRAVFAAIGFGTGLAAALFIAVFRRRQPAIPFPAEAA